ncbi:MAG: hypothetical protein IPK13_23380 [Deltaproteobacteria bacterium]|nr:hypothetical protein [Deltaproteobacteria bacterium]
MRKPHFIALGSFTVVLLFGGLWWLSERLAPETRIESSPDRDDGVDLSSLSAPRDRAATADPKNARSTRDQARSKKGSMGADETSRAAGAGEGVDAVEQTPLDVRDAERVEGTVFVRGPWGSAPGSFGSLPAQESNPEGPMAIVGAAAGELLVVDQQNLRVQVFEDGRVVRSFDVTETTQDLALTKDGGAVALDRLADRSVKLYGEDGKLKNEIPIAGENIPEPGLVTGVFADDEGVWVEREHGNTVRIAGPDGAVDEQRPELPGRPTRDGRGVVAATVTDRVQGLIAVTVFERASLEHRWSRSIEFRAPVLSVVALDSDRQGRVFLVAWVGREREVSPFDIYDEGLVIVCLAAETGALVGRVETGPLGGGNETLRPVSVDDAGTVYVLRQDSAGAEIRQFRFP